MTERKTGFFHPVAYGVAVTGMDVLMTPLEAALRHGSSGKKYFTIPRRMLKNLEGNFSPATCFTMNRELLKTSQYCAPILRMLLERGDASFRPLSDCELTFERASISQSTDRFLGSASRMRDHFVRYIAERGFEKDGLALAFPDSPFQSIAPRFRKNDEAYEIVTCMRPATREIRAPVLVHKRLGELALDVPTSDARMGELRHRQPYDGIDDVTRRIARITVLVPGKELGIFSTDVLANDYSMIRERPALH